MGRISTRESKTIYQICREESGLSREKASELMDGMSTSRIEKIEYEAQRPTPYDIVQMCVITIALTAVKSATGTYLK